MAKSIKVASLFSGIGGFETGILNSFGKKNVEFVFSSEIDKYAAMSYELIYGEKPHGDIMQVDESAVPDHDILVGGFPCQDLSIAGGRAGIQVKCSACDTRFEAKDDIFKEYCPSCNSSKIVPATRSALFYEIARIAREKQPQMIVLENVKGLLSHQRGETMRKILITLSNIGYVVDFAILNTKYFHLPQNRERVFIVAVKDAPSEEWKVEKKNGLYEKTKKNLKEESAIRTFNFAFPDQQQVDVKLKEILEENVDEKYYLSEEKTSNLLNRLEKEARERTESFLIDDQGRTKKKIKALDIAPTLRRESHGNEPKLIEPELDLKMIGKIDMKGNDSIRRVYSPDGIAPTLTTMGGGHREPKIVVEMDRNNGINKEIDIAHTISASDWRGLNRNQKQNAVLEEKEQHHYTYRIRKLTPLECFKLQGFPKEYYLKLKEAKISDTQLYKMAGNAVSTNVIKSLFDQVKIYL